MKHITLVVSATIAATLAAGAQQTTQPTTPTPQTQVGCVAVPSTTPSPKGFHIHIPKVVRTAIDKQRSKIEDKTGVHVPTPEELAKQGQTAPCPQPAPVPAK